MKLKLFIAALICSIPFIALFSKIVFIIFLTIIAILFSVSYPFLIKEKHKISISIIYIFIILSSICYSAIDSETSALLSLFLLTFSVMFLFGRYIFVAKIRKFITVNQKKGETTTIKAKENDLVNALARQLFGAVLLSGCVFWILALHSSPTLVINATFILVVCIISALIIEIIFSFFYRLYRNKKENFLLILNKIGAGLIFVSGIITAYSASSNSEYTHYRLYIFATVISILVYLLQKNLTLYKKIVITDICLLIMPMLISGVIVWICVTV